MELANREATTLTTLKTRPEQFFKAIKVHSALDCIKSDSQSMGFLSRQIGEQKMLAAIVLFLSNLIEFFNVGKSMNSYQVGETAQLILSEFGYMKIEDLKLVFDRMKSGFYGELYDRLDGSVILHRLRLYNEERTDALYKLNQAKEQEWKTPSGKYVIKIGALYLRENGTNEFTETDKPELASLFSYDEAWQNYHWLSKKYGLGAELAIARPKPEIGLMDYIKQEAPQLMDLKTVYDVNYKHFKSRLLEIEQSNMSDAEKNRAKEKLVQEVMSK